MLLEFEKCHQEPVKLEFKNVSILLRGLYFHPNFIAYVAHIISPDITNLISSIINHFNIK